MGTLDAESKKIPINVQSGTKLTISGFQGYGNDNFNYGKSEPQFKPYKDEVKVSRGSRRGDKDELDKFVQNKWEMSTVKEDITK